MEAILQFSGFGRSPGGILVAKAAPLPNSGMKRLELNLIDHARAGREIAVPLLGMLPRGALNDSILIVRPRNLTDHFSGRYDSKVVSGHAACYLVDGWAEVGSRDIGELVGAPYGEVAVFGLRTSVDLAKLANVQPNLDEIAELIREDISWAVGYDCESARMVVLSDDGESLGRLTQTILSRYMSAGSWVETDLSNVRSESESASHS